MFSTCIQPMLIKSLFFGGFWSLCLIQCTVQAPKSAKEMNSWKYMFCVYYFYCSLSDPISVSYCPSACTEFKMLPGPLETSRNCFYQMLAMEWRCTLPALAGALWCSAVIQLLEQLCSGLWLLHFSMTWAVQYYSVALTWEEDGGKRGSVPDSWVRKWSVHFPFCCSCRTPCLPIPSVPQLALASLYLSSPGSSTIVKRDECCKINSVWLKTYKLSFFTDMTKDIFFKSLVSKWGSCPN